MPDLMTEFDDIIRALEEEQPRIDPGFARELDARAAAGFAKPRRRWRIALPYIAVPATGLAVLAFAISGISGEDQAITPLSSGGSTAAEPAQKAVEDAAPPLASRDSSSAASAGVAAPESFARGRVQEQTAAVTL